MTVLIKFFAVFPALIVWRAPAAHMEAQLRSSPPGAVSERPYRQVLHNNGDVQYTGDIQVGGQTLRAILDTGSFELLVLSFDCKVCGDQAELYNPAGSRHHRAGNSVAQHNFGSGVAFSGEAYDKIRVGPLESRHQQFWEVFDADMPVLEESSFQAIVGVGPPGGAAKLSGRQDKDDTKSLANMWQAFQERKVPVPERLRRLAAHLGQKGSFLRPTSASRQSDSPSRPTRAIEGEAAQSLCSDLGVSAFSVCIGRERGSPGYFVWNDDAPSQRGAPFTAVPIVGDVHWAAQLTNVRIGRGKFGTENVVSLGCSNGCAAVIDSGTSLIAAPKEVILQVDQALARLREDCSNIGDMPDLVFNLGGSEFSLPPDAYIGRVENLERPGLHDLLHFRLRAKRYACVPLFMDIDTDTQLGPMWILGLPFFRKYYSAFSFDLNAKPVQKQLSVAVADDLCFPTDGSSLLGLREQTASPKTVDMAKLRAPRWAEEAMSSKYYRV